VFEIFGRFEQGAYFGFAKHYRELVLSLYLGKLDLLVFHAQDLVNGPQAENSVLEKTFGWSFVQVLAMKEIIIDHFSREGLRALLVVQAQVRQASLVVV
jgi:hypothetical protein|tara:strand:+ start:40 stop:336 length:297 start_codon:yes stop_codon:yes gene_type:complete